MRTIDRNPCYNCGFNDEDFGCIADPNEPWTVPEECYLYDEDEVSAMIEFYHYCPNCGAKMEKKGE